MKFVFYAIVILSLALFLNFNHVSTIPNAEDKVYCEKITQLNLDSLDLHNLSLASQLKLIGQIQRRVINYTEYKEIPFNQLREPRQLYEQKRGMCFDRARTIEKSLSILGFKTRHVSLYVKSDSSKTTLLDVLTKHLSSHAISEVYVKDKWIYVSSINYFCSFDSCNNLYTFGDIIDVKNRDLRWVFSKNLAEKGYLSSNTFIVYGLYSRHGKMYPPYWSFPDINYKDFLYNFTELNRFM